MSVKFPFFGGGFGGGGKCRFYFYGRADFSEKKHGNGNVQANVARTIPDNLRALHMKLWGFRGKKGQKVHPNFAPNITMEFHYHAFFFPELFLTSEVFL